MKTVELGKSDIMALIPHRESMAFLNSVTILSKYEAVSRSVWEKDHPVFRGHFPEYAIVPGVFLLEAAAQLVSVLGGYHARQGTFGPELERVTYDKIGVLSGVRKTLIHKPVFPEQEVQIHIKVKTLVQRSVMAIGKGFSNDQKVCTFELLFAVAEKEELNSYLNQSA